MQQYFSLVLLKLHWRRTRQLSPPRAVLWPFDLRWLVAVHACLAERDGAEERWPVWADAWNNTDSASEATGMQDIKLVIIINRCCSLSPPVQPVFNPQRGFFTEIVYSVSSSLRLLSELLIYWLMPTDCHSVTPLHPIYRKRGPLHPPGAAIVRPT